MMPYIRLGGAITFVYMFGALILCLLNYNHKDLFKRTYLMFCFGSGGVAFSMFILSLLTIPFGMFSITTVFLALSVFLLFKIRYKGQVKDPWTLYDQRPLKASQQLKGGPFYKKLLGLFFILIIIVQIFYVISTSLLEPEKSWDGRARWGLKAKILYSEKNIYTDYFKNNKFIYNHPYYPLLVPLETSNVYFFLGSSNDRLVKILFVIYFFMLILAFYDLVRRYLSTTKALFFTALLATIPVFLRGEGSANTCMADVPLTFYCFIVVTLFLSNPTRTMIAIATGIVLFFVAFTKQEGLCYGLFYILSYAIAMRITEKTSASKIFGRHLMIAAMVFIILYCPWLIYRSYFIKLSYANAPASISLAYIMSKIHRVFFIVPRIIKECLKVRLWHIVWPLFFISLCIPKTRHYRKEIVFLILSITCFFAFYITIFTLSAWWGFQQDTFCKVLINSTISRLFMPLAPVVLLYSALSFCSTADSKV